MSLEWASQSVLFKWQRHPRKARVASAPDGSWYVAWQDEDGWSIGHTEDLTEPLAIRARFDGLPLRSDPELIAEAWAAGLGDLVVLHWNWKTESYCDDDDVLVSASWECACGAGDLNLANRPDAAAGARSHWRRELRVALEALEQS